MNDCHLNDMQVVIYWLIAHPEGALRATIAESLGWANLRTAGAVKRLSNRGRVTSAREHGGLGNVSRWYATEHAPLANARSAEVRAALGSKKYVNPRAAKREKTRSGSGQFAAPRSYGEFVPLDVSAYIRSLQPIGRRT